MQTLASVDFNYRTINFTIEGGYLIKSGRDKGLLLLNKCFKHANNYT